MRNMPGTLLNEYNFTKKKDNTQSNIVKIAIGSALMKENT